MRDTKEGQFLSDTSSRESLANYPEMSTANTARSQAARLKPANARTQRNRLG